MNKIDVHAHAINALRDNSSNDGGVLYPDADELIELYDSLQIGIGVLLPVISPEGQTTIITNEQACAIAEKYPNRFRWACNIDPRMGSNSIHTDFSNMLKSYKKMGAVGVGEITCNLNLDDPLVDNLFYYCEKTQMPITIHLSNRLGNSYGLVDSCGLPKLDRALSKFPDLVIVGHAQAFWSEISGLSNGEEEYPSSRIIKEGAIQRLLRNHKNLYCDLSARSGSNALMRDVEYAYIFLEEFQDRIMLGLDVCDIHSSLYNNKVKFLESAFSDKKISKATYEKICITNAAKLYGI